MRGATAIAVFADVHGNAPALRAVLNDIDRRGDISHIYCLGDMIAIGPDTNEVLEILFARSNLSMITGNHEEAVLRVLQGLHPGSPGTEAIHQAWIAERIAPEYASQIRALPTVLTPTIEGQKLLLLHYHQDAEGKLLPVDRLPSLEKLEEQYAQSDAVAVCFGHHHPRHFFRSERRYYVNPGALGCHDRPEARYAVLTCATDGVRVAMHDIPYDNRAFLASYERLGVPAGEFILQLFHGNQQSAVSG
jgi:predicted phosphodiesterase